MQEIFQLIDDWLSLKDKSFAESDFNEYKLAHSKRLLDNFFEMAVKGISLAQLYRLLILQKVNNVEQDIVLPCVIFGFICILYQVNKHTSWMKHYFHICCIPLVGVLVAKKTIAQNKEKFYLNESFASWLLMMLLGGFSSSMQWYSVVLINCLCFIVYLTLIFQKYDLKGINNDFYVHIPTTIIFSGCLVRMNEVNLRNSFSLLNQSKVQEKKWLRVLNMLTDGILIMQHTENDDGIVLQNPSLEKIFGNNPVSNNNKSGDNSSGLKKQGAKGHLSKVKTQMQINDGTQQIRKQDSAFQQAGGVGNTGTNSQIKCMRCRSMQQVGLESTEDQKDHVTPQNVQEGLNARNLKHNNNTASSGFSPQNVRQGTTDTSPFKNNQSLGSFGQNYCTACTLEQQKINEEDPINKPRYNEKQVGPVFDRLFRNVHFKVIPFGQSADYTGNGDMVEVSNRHSKDPQFLNDFICKQMEYWKKKKNSMGHRERIFLKIFDQNKLNMKTIELNMVKLDNESQVLFLFKEVSIYNRLQKARTTERFTNLLINSIAHNLFTPLNALINLNKTMGELISGFNATAEHNGQMIGQCLQQLVFTSHNILEMSKIRQGKFKTNESEINLPQKLAMIFQFFKEDMKYREIDYEIKIEQELEQKLIHVDSFRFEIVLYNLISNSVKHTNGGHIKVSVKLLDLDQMQEKLGKFDSKKRAMEQKKHALKWNQEGSSCSEEDDNSENSFQSKMISTQRRHDEFSESEYRYLSISVSDTGVGMSEYVQRNCFALFGNLKFKNNINQGGMGLGLTASNLICKALGGSVNLIRSELNIGSKFNFILRIRPGRDIEPTFKEQEEEDADSKDNCDNQVHVTRKQSLIMLEESLQSSQIHNQYRIQPTWGQQPHGLENQLMHQRNSGMQNKHGNEMENKPLWQIQAQQISMDNVGQDALMKPVQENDRQKFEAMMNQKKFGFQLRKGAQVPPQHFMQIAFADRFNSPTNEEEEDESVNADEQEERQTSDNENKDQLENIKSNQSRKDQKKDDNLNDRKSSDPRDKDGQRDLISPAANDSDDHEYDVDDSSCSSQVDSNDCDSEESGSNDKEDQGSQSRNSGSMSQKILGTSLQDDENNIQNLLQSLENKSAQDVQKDSENKQKNKRSGQKKTVNSSLLSKDSFIKFLNNSGVTGSFVDSQIKQRDKSKQSHKKHPNNSARRGRSKASMSSKSQSKKKDRNKKGATSPRRRACQTGLDKEYRELMHSTSGPSYLIQQFFMKLHKKQNQGNQSLQNEATQNISITHQIASKNSLPSSKLPTPEMRGRMTHDNQSPWQQKSLNNRDLRERFDLSSLTKKHTTSNRRQSTMRQASRFNISSIAAPSSQMTPNDNMQHHLQVSGRQRDRQIDRTEDSISDLVNEVERHDPRQAMGHQDYQQLTTENQEDYREFFEKISSQAILSDSETSGYSDDLSSVRQRVPSSSISSGINDQNYQGSSSMNDEDQSKNIMRYPNSARNQIEIRSDIHSNDFDSARLGSKYGIRPMKKNTSSLGGHYHHNKSSLISGSHQVQISAQSQAYNSGRFKKREREESNSYFISGEFINKQGMRQKHQDIRQLKERYSFIASPQTPCDVISSSDVYTISNSPKQQPLSRAQNQYQNQMLQQQSHIGTGLFQSAMEKRDNPLCKPAKKNMMVYQQSSIINRQQVMVTDRSKRTEHAQRPMRGGKKMHMPDHQNRRKKSRKRSQFVNQKYEMIDDDHSQKMQDISNKSDECYFIDENDRIRGRYMRMSQSARRESEISSRFSNQSKIGGTKIIMGSQKDKKNIGKIVRRDQDGNSKFQSQGELPSPILIVDDTVFNIKCLAAQIEQKYKIITDQAISGEEAIMKCRQRVSRGLDTYRLIMMDINMPGMDGAEATAQIREFTDEYVKKRQQAHYMIIAHTALPEEQFGNYQEKGFDGFLQKAGDENNENKLKEFLRKVELV